MAGFVIELVAPGTEFGGSLKLVDLGQCELVQSRIFGAARIAWARWQAIRQLTIFAAPDRFLFVEGQPDRLPAHDEGLTQWLAGRAGSCRGFQVELVHPGGPPRICAFVDPLATRPIYLLRTAKRICLADKLASVVANTPGLDCAWPRLLECAALRSMYSSRTTVNDVEELGPGEVVEIEGVAIVRRRKALTSSIPRQYRIRARQQGWRRHCASPLAKLGPRPMAVCSLPQVSIRDSPWIVRGQAQGDDRRLVAQRDRDHPASRGRLRSGLRGHPIFAGRLS
jgi:hypothetical protein